MSSASGYKVCAYALHILCTLLALVLISFGVYVVVSYNTNEIGMLTAYAYIGIGVSAIVIFLWGYLAACRENVCCTVTFVTILYLIVFAQLGILVVLMKFESTSASNLANSLDTTWEEELNTAGAMSLYENWFHCCGRGSPQDYIVNERLPPATCFENHDASKADNLIYQGCRVEFQKYWEHLLKIFNIIACVLTFIEMILGLVSCCLCNSVRNNQRRSLY